MKTMNSKNLHKYILLLSTSVMIVLFMVLCNTDPQAGMKRETPTRGTIKISVDESMQMLLDTELYTFQAIYQNAHITAQYKPTLDVLNDFLDDSVRTVVSTIKLTKEEEDYLRANQFEPRTVVIAYDALALIINKNNPDSFLLSTDVQKIMKGTVKNWNQINPKNNSGDIKVIFDNLKSGNIIYFQEKFGIDSVLPANYFAAKTNEEVINYVEKNKDAVGIVSVNWISDKNDTLSQKFLSKIRVAAVSPEFDPENGTYARPYQAYIADKTYPYVREVYMICRETFTGLGSGFTQFVAGEKGQRIVLKSRLVPATMPIRLVQIKSE
jgi:phosphate transport system substrate-binding protein